MRIKSSWIKTITLPLALASLFACSDGAGNAPPFLDASGKHAPDWVVGHMSAYKQSADTSLYFDPASSCAAAACHGADGNGGSSKVSCFSGDTRNGQSCHAVSLGHPAGWIDPSSADFHSKKTPATANGIAGACGLCHDTQQDLAKIGDIPSCLAANSQSGMRCHATSPAANPAVTCVSCHSEWQNGTVAANRADAHEVHLALASVTCQTCHKGAGSGGALHALIGNSSTVVSFAAAYQARSGSAAFSSTGATCSNVSCHGGKTTPAWSDLASFDTDQCVNCHEPALVVDSQRQPSPQFNSYSSGRVSSATSNLHTFHNSVLSIACLTCHGKSKLAGVHFIGLDTPAFNTADGTTPGDTVGTTTVTNYDKIAKTCTASCHSSTKSWL